MLVNALFLVLVVAVHCDIYLHNPRGSNNRLNENTSNRRNANRAFDSQNNNKGGYNVGDRGSIPSRNREKRQYQMSYFQSGNSAGKTKLTVEWTNQHGCGDNSNGDQRNLCNIVIQYMCRPDGRGSNNLNDEIRTFGGNSRGAKCVFPFTHKGVTYNGCVPANNGRLYCGTTPDTKKWGYCNTRDLKDRIRDGTFTNTQSYRPPRSPTNKQQRSALSRKYRISDSRVIHEGIDWADRCYIRERNKGLFVADQNLKSNTKLGYSSAMYTRQNPKGTRRGLECPEERDYYPYWHPTPWKDIAILADDASRCPNLEKASFNVHPYEECVTKFTGTSVRKFYSRWNNRKDCEDNGGVWTVFHNFLEKAPKYTGRDSCEGASDSNHKYFWGIPYDSKDGTSEECLVGLHAPICEQSPWTRANHNGNGDGDAPNNFTWEIPHFPSKTPMSCVLRIRYNITTAEYNPYTTDSSKNGNESPIKNDPEFKLTSPQGQEVKLQLAVNTAQFGRTFQDRTHRFVLIPRPDDMNSENIYNVNVRGKRGNIVQVYPAVEYDFFPNDLNIGKNDLVHIQWTGSNTHNNRRDGDDGEGRRGTDRSNMVELSDLKKNYPSPFDSTTIWQNAKVKWIYYGANLDLIKPEDLALNLATSGFYRCFKQDTCGIYGADNVKRKLQDQLNNAPASYPGVVVTLKKGTYKYMCTRNNNFTNRSQKGQITVR